MKGDAKGYLDLEGIKLPTPRPTGQRDKLYLLVSSILTTTLDKDLFLSPFQLRSHQYLESSSLQPLTSPSSIFSCLEAFRYATKTYSLSTKTDTIADGYSRQYVHKVLSN